ncbi:LysM peptidoglycan-binding domain-containing protein [Pseudothauera nasutitermitis]|uniref:LysM peptidoglycan-binding domain-containing protein n=1 Tax=Pseudothauera nasutitermitis TaxID=2565930 RepID=A0A4S4B086_9RHOO|nr:peptidoglycan DD-metalloendopeptidase family protein [Pseudothauera nasutitermitis]THF65756.1 LysM peptidoglycan-binding domain-containing protein [Pseudothauera nasutitermitis]
MSGGFLRVAALCVAAGLLAGCAGKTAAPVRDVTQAPPPESVTAQPVVEDAHAFHTVSPGETLLAISRQYGHSVADLVAWNGLTNPNQIQVGQQLRVSPPGGAVAEVVAIPDSTELRPLPGAADVAGTPVLQEPKGGRQPYSDEAWARTQGHPAPVASAPPSVPAPQQVPAPDAATAGQWAWPVASGNVLLGFEQPKGENGKLLNKGLDIGGTPGTPVLASAPGTVMYAGSGLRGFGKLVIIRHESDYQTVYAHNQQLLVKEGDTVTRGQKIAELGSTDADRPMLHFEIRRQGRPLDPMKYLPAR